MEEIEGNVDWEMGFEMLAAEISRRKKLGDGGKDKLEKYWERGKKPRKFRKGRKT